MSEFITIPKQDEFKVDSIKGNDGPIPKTTFIATDKEGNTISPCESWGNRTEILKQYMESGAKLEVESVSYNERWNCYQVKFFKRQFVPGKPGGSTGWKPGGGGSGWKPAGYAGKAMPKSNYLDQVSGAYSFYFDQLINKLPPPARTDAGILQATIEAAARMANQFAINLEKNVVYVDGFQAAPAAPAAATQGAASAAPVASATAERPQGDNSDSLPGESAAFVYLADKVNNACPSDVALDDAVAKELQGEVRQTGELSKREASELLLRIYKKTQVGKAWSK